MRRNKEKFPQMRDDVISQAVDQCIKELYTLVQPKVSWTKFKKECEEYSTKYREWESHKGEANLKDTVGPKPYEFYYLPEKVMRDICERYVYMYDLDKMDNFKNIVDVLKEYMKEPTVDKYIEAHEDEDGDYHPGYRGYDHPDGIIKSLTEKLGSEEKANIAYDDVCRYFDMALKFYCWNRDLHAFNMNVYLYLPSPCSNKKTVIKNWKQYRGKDITIDESKYKDFYDEEAEDE